MDDASCSVLWEELAGASPDEEHISSLCAAHANILLKRRLSDGSNALHIAMHNICVLRNKRLVTFLISACSEAAAAPNNLQLSPIHKAVAIATSSVVDSLALLIDANPQALLDKSRDGMTPLHVAVSVPRNPCSDVVTLLIAKSPLAARMADCYGQYPLHRAASNARVPVEVIEQLVTVAGDTLPLKDNKGLTPLHWALSKPQPNVDVVFALVDHYPQALLEIDYQGNTPTMRYALNKSIDHDVHSALMQLSNLIAADSAEQTRNKADFSVAVSGTRSSMSSRNSCRSSMRK